MRISTPQIYDNGVFGLLQNQYQAYRLQNQMSTSRRVVTPADDPVAAGQALVTEQKKNVNQQFLDNQGNASAQLGELENLMTSVGNLLIDVKARWVEAGNGGYSDNELQSIAVDLRGKLEHLFGVANNADATGLYRFAGYQGATQPFVNDGGAISYQGDSGERLLQVETGRFIAVSFSGREFFEAIPNGNGVIVAEAGTGNAGSGVIESSSVVGNFSGSNYEIQFTSTSPPIYDVFQNGTPISTGNTYTSGDAIMLGSDAQIAISGAPAVGDTFTVSPSREESVFATLSQFISTLETGDNSSAAYKNAMLNIGANLDQALQHVLDNRAVVGARMAELDDLTNLGKDLDVQYKTQISDLVDLDYASAISELSKNQLQLQAAEQSFVKVTSLSLFNFI